MDSNHTNNGFQVEVGRVTYGDPTCMFSRIFARQHIGFDYIAGLKAHKRLRPWPVSGGEAIFIRAAHLAVAVTRSRNLQGL